MDQDDLSFEDITFGTEPSKDKLQEAIDGDVSVDETPDKTEGRKVSAETPSLSFSRSAFFFFQLNLAEEA
jgi:hypothetical protein